MSNTNEHMEQLPIKQLLWKMTIPAVVGVMAYNFYNLFDTLFLSRGAGMNAVGGVAVSFPLFFTPLGYFIHSGDRSSLRPLARTGQTGCGDSHPSGGQYLSDLLSHRDLRNSVRTAFFEADFVCDGSNGDPVALC